MAERNIDGGVIFQEPKERRVKVMGVSVVLVVDSFFRPQAPEGGRIQYVTFEGIPAGCEVLGVRHDYLRNCFDFILYHPSWPVVGDCEEPERIMPQVTAHSVEVVQQLNQNPTRDVCSKAEAPVQAIGNHDVRPNPFDRWR